MQEHIVFSYMKNPDLRTGGVLKSGEKRKREHITSGLVCFPDADVCDLSRNQSVFPRNGEVYDGRIRRLLCPDVQNQGSLPLDRDRSRRSRIFAVRVISVQLNREVIKNDIYGNHGDLSVQANSSTPPGAALHR